ncbi:hypothetical protein J0H58_21035 [bacterium]|nr:hypothetical protein [bacterium]
MSLSASFGTTSLRATCAEEFDSLVEDLFGLIRHSVAKGAVLRDGTRILFGWTVLTVRGERGDLALCEPDFGTDPTAGLRENIDFSLAGYRRQQNLIAAVGLDQWRPLPYTDDVFVERGALGDEQVIGWRMSDPQGADGWFVFRIHSDCPKPALDITTVGGQFGRVPVWHLALSFPAQFDMLALPIGYTVRITGGAIDRVQSPDGEVWTMG